MSNTKKLTLSALFLALGILLPYVFHATKLGGPVFLPMHIPVLLAGFFVGPFYALAIGAITPVLSGIMTGMPPFAPFPSAVVMAFELATYGFFAGLFYEKLRMNPILSLVLSMVFGRIVAGLVVFVLVVAFGFNKQNPVMYVWGGLVTGWLGILIQLVFIPVVVEIARKAGLHPKEQKVE
ncbi:MAG: ECF transporter S component [Caldisericales bacterium]|nr:ECF transporter S component [Caldisericales bacterium]